MVLVGLVCFRARERREGFCWQRSESNYWGIYSRGSIKLDIPQGMYLIDLNLVWLVERLESAKLDTTSFGRRVL